MQRHRRNIVMEIQDNLLATKTKNDEDVYMWSQYEFTLQIKEKRDEVITKPLYDLTTHTNIFNDAIKFFDDTSLKVDRTDEIYPKLTNFGETTYSYKLPINWDERNILSRQTDQKIRSLKRSCPGNTVIYNGPNRQLYLSVKLCYVSRRLMR